MSDHPTKQTTGSLRGEITFPDMANVPSPPFEMALRRVLAVVLATGLLGLYFGGFLLAEQDAYTQGHGGYVHDPTGVLSMVCGFVLFLPGGFLIDRLWREVMSTPDPTTKTIIAPARPPNLWQRLLRWLQGTEPPKIQTFIVTDISHSHGGTETL